MSKQKIITGDICRTNLSQPGGLVMVVRIEPSDHNPSRMAAQVLHVEDHPYGYKTGDYGWYMVDELVFVGRPIWPNEMKPDDYGWYMVDELVFVGRPIWPNEMKPDA